MENNRFKNRISRMFHGSCRARNLSDVIEKAIVARHINCKDLDVIEPCKGHLPLKARPFPSICRPTCPESTTRVVNYSILPRQKVSAHYPPFVSASSGRSGHTCPPASPVSPLKEKKSSSSEKNEKNKKKKKNTSTSSEKNKKKKKNTNTNTNKREMNTLFSSSSRDSAYFDWFSSEADDESDIVFSSRSFSSDSSGSHHLQRKNRVSRRRRAATTGKSSQMGVLPLMDGKVKDSFAVVKSSSDPYNDFRTSMVEMIIEKQIFSAKDLEHLLQCFLSLNSYQHHRTIVKVFTEIWEALFSCN